MKTRLFDSLPLFEIFKLYYEMYHFEVAFLSVLDVYSLALWRVFIWIYNIVIKCGGDNILQAFIQL